MRVLYLVWLCKHYFSPWALFSSLYKGVEPRRERVESPKIEETKSVKFTHTHDRKANRQKLQSLAGIFCESQNPCFNFWQVYCVATNQLRNKTTKNSIKSRNHPYIVFRSKRWLLPCSFMILNLVSGGVVEHVEFVIWTSNSSTSTGANTTLSLVRCKHS